MTTVLVVKHHCVAMETLDAVFPHTIILASLYSRHPAHRRRCGSKRMSDDNCWLVVLFLDASNRSQFTWWQFCAFIGWFPLWLLSPTAVDRSPDIEAVWRQLQIQLLMREIILFQLTRVSG